MASKKLIGRKMKTGLTMVFRLAGRSTAGNSSACRGRHDIRTV